MGRHGAKVPHSRPAVTLVGSCNPPGLSVRPGPLPYVYGYRFDSPVFSGVTDPTPTARWFDPDSSPPSRFGCRGHVLVGTSG